MNRYSPMIRIAALIALFAFVLSGCVGLETAVRPSIEPSIAPETTAPAAETATPSAEPSADTTAPDQTASVEPSAVETQSVEPTATPTATVEPTATPTATPAPTPSPTPVATHLGDRADVKVLRYFDNKIPEGVAVKLLYTKYATPLDYFVVLHGTSVREMPNPKAKSLKKAGSASRLPLIAEVQGTDGKLWYRVKIDNSVGYVPLTAGSVRTFQLDQALERVKTMKKYADMPGTVHVNNYKNRAGKVPPIDDKPTDKYGYRRDQGAPAYLSPTSAKPSRYLPDGMVGEKLGVSGTFMQVYFPYFDEVWYVPTKFLDANDDAIKTLTQVAVVDRKNQNVIVMQYAENQWQIVSMNFVSTGKNTGYSLPTPLGDFAAIGKVPKFYYYNDGTETIGGYAPYAVRFTGGAYLHGVPRGVNVDPVTKKVIQPLPPTRESNGTLGTTPQSHMCVRNYTSHALFLYEWMKIGSAAVIVIE